MWTNQHLYLFLSFFVWNCQMFARKNFRSSYFRTHKNISLITRFDFYIKKEIAWKRTEISEEYIILLRASISNRKWMRRFLEGGNFKFPPTMRRKQDFQLQLLSRDEIRLLDGEKRRFCLFVRQVAFYSVAGVLFLPVLSRLVSVPADRLSLGNNLFWNSSNRKIF